VPAAYTGNAAVPLVLNLHGYGSNNFEQEIYGDFRAVADTANFLIVHPNGTVDQSGSRFWNTFNTGATVNDVQFLSNLIDSLSATYNIDPNRIYSTGMSNGGFMSYTLACELSDRVAAIASVTGSMTTFNLNTCNPGRPVPVMEIHGTADATVPYNGGGAFGNFAPIPDVLAAWVDKNNCNPTPIFTAVPNTVTNDGCTAERYLYPDGDLGSTVEHYKIIGGAHTWPGAFIALGATNYDIKASPEIWRFFRQYRLDQFVTATHEAQAAQWSVYPNPTRDFLTVQGVQPNQRAGIRVYDVLGRLQQTLTAADWTDGQIATSAWKPGVYFLVLEGVGSVRVVRV
jgi:polyhydroxybutyrate depolymerase